MSDALREEHDRLQRAVKASRREAATSGDSAFVRTMIQAMEDYREARAGGLSREDGIRGLESVLRSCWTHPPSKFGPACDACGDTGWTEHTCWAEVRCDRRSCQEAHPSREHTYVVPCHCARGDGPGGRRRAAQVDEISEAMKTRKPKTRGLSRF
jgi:hypothetical protein